MHLITMAHLGEAQGVIDLFKLKKINSHFFEGELLSCLVTGEGPFESATATAAILGQRPYQQVINLGIAGSLAHEYPVGEIHPVRSLYLVIDGVPQFKSFKSFEQGLDCLTSFERILSPEKAKKLSGLGQLVDREAWGVAMAAKSLSVSFHSYKLISDVAGSLGACEIVREHAEVWSYQLATFLQDKLSILPSKKQQQDLPGFYFTFSTQHQFEQMLNKLSIRENLSESQVLAGLALEELREQKLLPKERARLLLKKMEERIDPLKQKLTQGLEQWKAPFEKHGINLVTDPTWENADVKVNFTLKDEQDLQLKLAALKCLSLKPFQKLRDGNLHVE